jgi:hypothetical protein
MAISNYEGNVKSINSYFFLCRWLSKGKALQRVWSIRHEIEQFLGEIGGDTAEGFVEILRSEDSKRDMAFLTDMLGHLNDLNLKLQGEGKNVTELWHTIKSFDNKLVCFFEDIVGDMNHFPTVKEHINAQDNEVDLSAAQAFITSISTEMDRRFAAFDGISHIIELVSCPTQAQQLWKEQIHKFPNMRVGPIELELCDFRVDVNARAQLVEQSISGF